MTSVVAIVITVVVEGFKDHNGGVLFEVTIGELSVIYSRVECRLSMFSAN